MRNLKRTLSLLLALCLVTAVPGVAFAGDWGGILDNTEAAWNGTYYCEGCGQPLTIRAGVEPTATMHVRVWNCANSACEDYYLDPADGTAEFLSLNGKHSFDATGTCYCGYYDSSQASCSHTSCDYSYTYYNGTYHRYVQTCLSCGTTVSSALQSHSTTSDCVYEDASTHSHQTTCTLCDTLISSVSEDHSWSSSYSQHNDNQHKITHKCGGCLYSSVSYANHADDDGDGECDLCGYGMARFSVTVPATLPLAMAENGQVYAAEATIVNNSSAAVKVADVLVNAQNGWTLVPYDTNMARAKVDARQVGFSLNGAATDTTGSQHLTLTGDWTISRGGSLALDYDAVISALSAPVTDEAILSVVFVLEWA